MIVDGAVEGVAVTGLTTGSGTWQYSTDSGSSWSDVGTVSDNSALLLRAVDRLRFIPDQEKLTEYGVTNALVGYMLRTSIYGDDSNTYKEKGEEYKINVELDKNYSETIEDIKQINIH